MITYTKSEYVIGGTYRISGYCLSSDTKPTDVSNGSQLIEMNTGKIYVFDEANKQWIELQ